MLADCLMLGDDPKELENYGTLEELIKGDEIYKSDGAHVVYVSDKTLTAKEFWVRVKVESQKKEEAKSYPIIVYLQREQVGNQILYRIQDTKDIKHECSIKEIQETRALLPLPCCKHCTAAVEAVEDELTKAIKDARRDNVKITSYYSENNLLPVPDELIEFYETVKHEKQVPRFRKLQGFFHSKIKLIYN